MIKLFLLNLKDNSDTYVLFINFVIYLGLKLKEANIK